MRRTPVGAAFFLALLTPSLSAQLTITARAASIAVGGHVHIQHSVSSVDGTTAGTTDAVDDIFVRRAVIQLNLRIGDVDAQVDPDFGSGPGLRDTFVRWALAREARLSVGQFKRAFSIFDLATDFDLPDIERDARIEGLTSCPGVGNVCGFSRLVVGLQFDDRDIGVRAEGDLGSKVQYLATVTNGQGRNNFDVNDAKSVSGRVVVALRPTLRLAGFAASHDYLASPTVTRRGAAIGADLEVGTWRNKFHLLAGVVGGDNWLVNRDAGFNSVQAIGTYYFPLREGGKLAALEPMLRIDRSATEDATGLGIHSLILTPGLSFYVNGRNWLGINFDHYDPSRGESAWSLKTQMFFFY
jgi:hypothetical protein